MLKESNISPNETRSRSGPPSRLAATQEPERNAVLKPARGGELGGEAIPDRRHDDEAGLGQQGAQAIGSIHGRHSSGVNFRPGR